MKQIVQNGKHYQCLTHIPYVFRLLYYYYLTKESAFLKTLDKITGYGFKYCKILPHTR